MVRGRVAAAVLQRQDRHSSEVIFRQVHLAIENGYQVLSLHGFRVGIRAMTLQTEGVDITHSQQIRVRSPVRLMADGAALPESRLVRVRLLALLRHIRMTIQADRDGIGL